MTYKQKLYWQSMNENRHTCIKIFSNCIHTEGTDHIAQKRLLKFKTCLIENSSLKCVFSVQL